jgi:predicted acetyltransferase
MITRLHHAGNPRRRATRYRPPVPIEIRPVTDPELPAWFEAASTVFFMWPWGEPNATAEFRRPHLELDRSRAAFDGTTIVGTYRTFPTPLTLPGLGSITASAVTAVTVRSTHRRRGILSAFEQDDIARAKAAGEAVGVLIAAEWPIYGRYGYGPATWRGRWSVRSRAARFKVEAPGSVEVVAAKRARELIPGIYDRYRAGQPGEIGRTDIRWDVDLGIAEPPGRKKVSNLFAIHHGTDGQPDAYAIYHGEEKWDDGIPDNVLVLEELHATSDAAELAMWQYLCSIDLVATINSDTRRPREPLTWALEDARALRLKEVTEMLWVRIFDVPAALAARRYERADRLVIEVVDRVGEGAGPAAGRFELEASPDGATCRATTKAPDLTLEVRALGAAYLGGTRLIDAVRAGGAAESTAGALTRADALFRTADEPWCSTGF